MDRSPENLIRACLAGDERAWDEVLERYGRLMWAVIRRAGLGDGEAEEVFQRAWIAVVDGMGRIRKPDRLGSWIAATTRHHVYRYFDDRTRRRREVPLEDDAVFAVSGAVEEALEAEQRTQAMRESVAQLGQRCRVLLRLLFFSDPPLDYETVAERSGLAIGSIGPIRARCLARLRKIFDRVYQGGSRPDTFE